MSPQASRWLLAGVAVGCAIAILLTPPARNRALDGLYYGLNEVPVWQKAVAAAPAGLIHSPDANPGNSEQEFLNQLAISTMLLTVGSSKEHDATQIRDCIRRLEALRERFPKKSSIYAHLGRYYAAIVALDKPVTKEEHAEPWAVTHRDWERLSELMRRGSQLEPNNAYFIQMLAAAYLGMNKVNEALSEWENAASKDRWRDYAEEEVFAQWELLESIYGARGARLRFPAIAMLRLPHPALIEEAANRFLDLALWVDNPKERIRLRILNARNGALIREQARQVVAGLVGIEINENAIQWGPRLHGPVSPKKVEQRRAEFRRVILRYLPSDEAKKLESYVVRQARRNDGYHAQIPRTSAMEFAGWNTVSGGPELWTGWLFRSISMSALVDGSFGLMVRFALAWAVAVSMLTLSSRWKARLPERLRGAFAVFLGLLVGSVAYLGSSSWLVGVWYALLVGGFCYASASDAFSGFAPSGTEYIMWTRTHAFWALVIVFLLFVLNALGFIFRYADFPGVHLALTGVAAPAPPLSVQQWVVVGWVAVSLPLAVCIAWAAKARTALVPATAEALARLSAYGIAFSALVFVVALPFGIVSDREDVIRLEHIAKNEPNYYRRTAEPISAGYHDTAIPEGEFGFDTGG